MYRLSGFRTSTVVGVAALGTAFALVAPGSADAAPAAFRPHITSATWASLDQAYTFLDQTMDVYGTGSTLRLPQSGRALSARASAAAVYCSDACRAKAWRMRRRTRARTAAVVGGAVAVCPGCGSSWTVGIEHQVGAVYCSPRCRWRAARQRGAQSLESDARST